MDVKHIASLSALTLTAAEERLFARQFSQTLETVAVINELDTAHVDPLLQITGAKNITRPDRIDTARILTVDQALSQASRVHQTYFVVPRLIDRHG